MQISAVAVTILHDGVPHYSVSSHETLAGIVESFCSSRHVSTWKRTHAITSLSLLRAQVDTWPPLLVLIVFPITTYLVPSFPYTFVLRMVENVF